MGKELYYHKRYKEAAVFLTYLERSDGWHIDRIDARAGTGHFAFYQLESGMRHFLFCSWGLREGIPDPELCCDLGWWFFFRKAVCGCGNFGTARH